MKPWRLSLARRRGLRCENYFEMKNVVSDPRQLSGCCEQAPGELRPPYYCVSIW
jgi:hypothetical protein